jgi:hypothetical protein
MGDRRVLMERPEGRRQLGIPRHRWEDIIKMCQRKWDGGLEWIALAQDRNRQRTLVNADMNIRFHKMWGISWLAENLSGFVKGIYLMDLVG